MRLTAVGALATVALLVPSCQPGCEPPGPPPSTTTTTTVEPTTTIGPTTTSSTTTTTTTTTAPATGIVSVRVDGQGSGHGRGLSAWGSYGSAVNLRWAWQDILAHYYGGTVEGTAVDEPVRVRLLGLDNRASTAVVSTIGQATWNGTAATSLQAVETGPNSYDLYSAADLRCPGATLDGWTLVATGVAGPVTFTTPVDERTAPAGEVFGVCQPNGSVIHYRGTVTALNDGAGANRTVTTTFVETYLRSVLSLEVPTSWGNSGGGAGMNALRAQAVAARTFALGQTRYSYADTCNTSSCQNYVGAAYRSTPASATSFPAWRLCETGNETQECRNTDRAIVDTAGAVRRWPNGSLVTTEYSSSHGPYSAGGPFPSVDDTASNVAGNSSFTWTRSIDAATLEARYALGDLTAASTEPDPSTPHVGVWDHRVRLVGTLRTVVVSGWDFKNALGLPSPGFTITAS